MQKRLSGDVSTMPCARGTPRGNRIVKRRPTRRIRDRSFTGSTENTFAKFRLPPEIAQVETLLLKRTGVIGQVGDIDGTRRDAGQERSFQIRKTLGDSPQHADLISRPRSAAPKAIASNGRWTELAE